ncbi:MAG: prephenate dehydratase [Actinomycetota bacterium]|nr:prephenate dehydratase [Actinomycetota bacterium]
MTTLKKIGFLGPRGTFSEEALMEQRLRGTQAETVPFATIAQVLEAVAEGQVDTGFVPIENSIEGSVSATIDSLIFDYELSIVGEYVHDIHHDLMALANTSLDDIETVISHPQPLAQCRKFLAQRLPNAILRATTSTSEAAREVSESGDNSLAAIAPHKAAEIYSLSIINSNIEDHSGNQTRFIEVTKEGLPPRTGNDRTSIACFQVRDEPGFLFSILAEFYARRINLTKIESRPSKKGLGEYCFVIELDGHVRDPLVADALVNLKDRLADVRFMGSYPKYQGSASLSLSSDDPGHLWIEGILKRREFRD